MSTWLMLWVRYLWPLFGHTILSFVVPCQSQRRGQCVCVWNVKKKALEQLSLCDISWQSKAMLTYRYGYAISAPMTGSWSCVSFSTGGTAACETAGALSPLVCWSLSIINETVTRECTAFCHRATVNVALIEMFDLLLLFFSIWAREEAENSKEVHRGAAIYFRNIRFER